VNNRENTPTELLRKVRIRKTNQILDTASVNLVSNKNVLSWFSTWLQQDLLVPLDAAEGGEESSDATPAEG
jgi:hypothetical protein